MHQPLFFLVLIYTFDLQNENFSYIQQVTGSIVKADAQWSGIQDGVTFAVQHKSFSNVKEATKLLNKMIDSVRKSLLS